MQMGKNGKERTSVMRTVAAGKEHIYLNSPEGTRFRLTTLRKKVAETIPPEEAGVWCRDNGMFLAFVLDRFERALEISTGEKAKELDEKEREVNQKAAELERLVKAVEEEHASLLIAFRKEGGDAEDLLALLRLAKASGVRPKELVRLMDAGNVPGLAAMLAHLEARTKQRSEEIKELDRIIAEIREIVAQLVRKKEELEREVEAKARELEQARKAVELTCAVARDVGLYVDWIRQACEVRGGMRVQDVMLTPALVMAGAILEAAAQAYGDKEITLMPGRKHPLPVQVSLREISRSLAPPEAYAEQIAAAERR